MPKLPTGLLRKKGGGICVVECIDAEAARFVDPPLGVDMDAQARAAMELVRRVLAKNTTDVYSGGTLIKWFVEQLIAAPAPETVLPVKRIEKSP